MLHGEAGEVVFKPLALGTDHNETALGFQYNNATQQGQMDAQRAQAQAQIQQQQTAQNEANQQYWNNQQVSAQNRQQDVGIDYQKTAAQNALQQQQIAAGIHAPDVGAATAGAQLNQQGSQFDANRTDKYVGTALNAAGSLGQSLLQSKGGGGTDTGGGVSPGPGIPAAPSGGAAPADNGYGTDSTIKDPWADA